MVVFRARSRGGAGTAGTSGIYIRDMDEFGAIRTVFTRGAAVPQPNNALYNGQLARFNEFPSVPRIDAELGHDCNARPVAHRSGRSRSADGSRNAHGHRGRLHQPEGRADDRCQHVGDVYGDASGRSFEYFQVPIAERAAWDGLRPVPGFARRHRAQHDRVQGQFRRAWRRQDRCLLPRRRRPSAAWRRSKWSRVRTRRFPVAVPGTAARSRSARPRRRARRQDRGVCRVRRREAVPTAGGIYRAQLGKQADHAARKSSEIGDLVPGEVNQRFKTFGEAISLSSNGRSVLFWGTWGTETRKVTVDLPGRGQRRPPHVLQAGHGQRPRGRGAREPGVLRPRHAARHDRASPGRVTASMAWKSRTSCTGTSRPRSGRGRRRGRRRRHRGTGSLAFDGVWCRVRQRRAHRGGVQGPDRRRQGRDLRPSPGRRARRNRQAARDRHAGVGGLDPETPSAAAITSVGIERDGFRGQLARASAAAWPRTANRKRTPAGRASTPPGSSTTSARRWTERGRRSPVNTAAAQAAAVVSDTRSGLSVDLQVGGLS